jgi:hypothetical protein
VPSDGIVKIYNLYEDLNIVDDIKIRGIGWAGLIVRMQDERIPPKRFLMGNFKIRHQWENQEQDVRMSSGGTHHRS